MARIFLSHSSKNNAQALALRSWLAEQGWGDEIFLDIDPAGGIAPGERWLKRLNEAADRCEAVIFLISRDWLASRWCHEELALAHKLNKRLFGVLIDNTPVADVPPRLRDEWQLIDLESARDGRLFQIDLPNGEQYFATFSAGGLERLRGGLVKAGLDPRFFVWPPAYDPQRAPYRGLAAMDEEDAGIFYGREAATTSALDQLRGLAEAPPPRLLTVLGASGAGKSSFMRAGLIPRLKRDDRHFLVLPIVRPERAAISGRTGLVACLEEAGRLNGLKWTRSRIERAIGDGHQGVAELLSDIVTTAMRRLAAPEDAAPPAIILPIDQAEELFIDDDVEEARLLDLLAGLLKLEQLNFLAVATIRTDSYEELQLAPAFTGIRQVPFNLPALARGAYQRVIEGPTERMAAAGRPLKIDPALTAALLADIEEGGAKDALPLLAFTMARLYEDHGGDGDITLAEYEESGRIAGAIEAAVGRALKAADADPGVPKEREAKLALLRSAMIPWLAGIDPETKTARRQVARFDDIPDEAQPLIEHFIEQRLLASDVSKETGERTVEPAHEALLRQWRLIDGWLNEDLAVLATLESVRRAARDWNDNGRHADWLAHSGGRLEDTEAVKSRADLARRLDAIDLAYLDACRAAEKSWQDERLDEARKLAEAQRVAAEQAAAREQAERLAAAEATALAETRRVAAEQAKEREEEQRQAAEAATKAATRFKRQAMRTRIIAIAATVLAAVAVGAGYYAFERAEEADRQASAAVQAGNAADEARKKAEEESKRAELEKKNAEDAARKAEEESKRAELEKKNAEDAAKKAAEAAAEALLNETVSLAALSRVAGSEGFNSSAVKLALAAWPRVGDELRPMLRRTVAALAKSLPSMTERQRFEGQAAALSPDGTRVLTWWADNARLWDAATGAPLGAPIRHESMVQYAAFSPDGTRIVTAVSDGTARMWDVASGELLGKPLEHGGVVWWAIFSPDGTRIVTTSSDSTAQIWDVASSARMGAPMKHEDDVWMATFSADGRRLVTASSDYTARLWDASSGAPLGQPMRHKDLVLSAVFSPDGMRVATASWDKTAQLWDAATQAPIGEPMQHQDSVVSAAFSHDGARIVTASDDDTARLWDAASGAPLGQPMQHENRVGSAAFSPDGTRVLTASLDSTARLWDGASGAPLGEPLLHEDVVRSASFSSDGARIVTASDDSVTRLWDAEGRTAQDASIRHDADVNTAFYSPDGTRIVTASHDGTARQWDAATGAPIGEPMRHDDPVVYAVYSPDGKRIVTASWDRTAQLWDATTGARIGEPMRHRREVAFASFSADGKRIATASWDTSARLWDGATGAPLGDPIWHEDFVYSAAFSPDGTRIVTASKDETARLWDAATGAPLGEPMQHGRYVRTAVFSPDGTRILTASGNGLARLWDAASGAPLGGQMRHELAVNTAVFSPDGRLIVTVSDDKTARLWEAASGAPLGDPIRHEDTVWSGAFSPDGLLIVTGSKDGTVRILDVSPLVKRDAFQIACQQLGNNTSLADVAARYGLSELTPICADNPPLPVDLSTLQ